MPYYSATKHALEGYSESLDHEVREFGVRVAVIEPAATKTSFESSTVQADRPLATYDASRAKYLAAFERAMAVADTAESVAETIVLAATDKTPRLRYPSGKARGRSRSHAGFFLGLSSTRSCASNSDSRMSGAEGNEGDLVKAFIVDRYGKKGQGRIGEMPDPELRENDVLVQVHSAGVNLLDSKVRSGEFKVDFALSFTADFG